MSAPVSVDLPTGSVPEETAVLATSGSDVTPWLNVGVGLGRGTEIAFTYLGNWLRLSGRWATWNKTTTLSIAAGLSGRYGLSAEVSGSGVNASDLYGWGADVPVVVSYRSDSDVILAWGGLRGRFLRQWGQISAVAVPATHVSADQWRAGAVLGVAAGFRPVWAAVEIAADRVFLNGWAGNPASAATSAGYWSLTPSAALLFRY